MHVMSNNMAGADMLLSSHSEKLRELAEDVDTLDTRVDKIATKIQTISGSLSDAEGVLKGYNKFAWLLVTAVLGTIGTAAMSYWFMS